MLTGSLEEGWNIDIFFHKQLCEAFQRKQQGIQAYLTQEQLFLKVLFNSDTKITTQPILYIQMLMHLKMSFHQCTFLYCKVLSGSS